MPRLLCVLMVGSAVLSAETSAPAAKIDPKIKKAVGKGLDWLARNQRPKQGFWDANTGQYRVAMTALAATALAAEGSTTTRGKYAKNISLAVDYLLEMATTTGQHSGLIGHKGDYHYTYGHGFSMLFLSQVYGEEEDAQRRQQLKEVLTKAVVFSHGAQTSRGGWGYVSAKDGNGFDEGSTCVTQVQGLRACRNAGIPVSKDIIEAAKKYIRDCTTPEGGVSYSYSNRGRGARPPITAAALASMFNAGEYDSEHTKKMIKFCEKAVWPGQSSTRQHFGHWHYTHYYYAQVMYRMGGDKWKKYSDQISKEILRQQNAQGAWTAGHIGPVYTTAINSLILQLDKGYLPIYQR